MTETETELLAKLRKRYPEMDITPVGSEDPGYSLVLCVFDGGAMHVSIGYALTSARDCTKCPTAEDHLFKRMDSSLAGEDWVCYQGRARDRC